MAPFKTHTARISRQESARKSGMSAVLLSRHRYLLRTGSRLRTETRQKRHGDPLNFDGQCSAVLQILPILLMPQIVTKKLTSPLSELSHRIARPVISGPTVTASPG